MTRFALISIVLVLGAPAAAQEQSAPPEAPSDAPPAKLQSLLQNCDAHKFETTVESVVDGKPHRSKVKMCGTEGQSDADWIVTLQDAIDKLEANTEVAESTRAQVVTAVKAEIERLKAGLATTASTSVLPEARPATSPGPLSNDYTVLPPLPAPSAPTPKVAAPSAGSLLEGGTSAIAARPSGPILPKAQALPLLPKPKLSFSCMSAEYPGGGPCVTLTRDTVLTVKSGEALPAGVALQFVRKGEQRAEVALGSMRKGQSVRFDFPRQVCSGVVTSEVDIAILRNGRAVGREGPYLLRC